MPKNWLMIVINDDFDRNYLAIKGWYNGSYGDSLLVKTDCWVMMVYNDKVFDNIIRCLMVDSTLMMGI